MLEIGIGAGVGAAAVLHDVPDLHYLGIDAGAAPLARAVMHELMQSYPGCVETRTGAIGQLFAELWRGRVRRFDRVRINGAPDYLTARYYLLEAFRVCAADGMILVEGCDLPHVNEAVVAVLAAGLAHIAEIPGWRYLPKQTLLRIGKRTEARPEPARIILVAVSGKSVKREWALSRPGIAAYAAKVGASLVEFTDDLAAPINLMAKLVALDRLGQEGRVLLLDTDIVIREDAPDLFDMVPLDAVGVFIEGQVVDRAEGLRNALSWYGCEAATPYYANTGVLLLPSELVGRFTLSAVDDVLHVDPVYEQGYFNALLHRFDFPVFNISPLFNCMPAVTPDRYGQAFFVHFAGGSLGLRQPKIWEEMRDPVSGRDLLVQRDLSAKELRLFDIRNELLLSRGHFDRLLSASHVLFAGGLLLLRNAVPMLRLPSAQGLLVWGSYLDLVPGIYEITILLAAAPFREAFLAGVTSIPDLFLPPDAPLSGVPVAIALDVTRSGGMATIISRRDVVVVAGCATISFTLHDVTTGVECHLFGRGESLDLYGLRFRIIDPVAGE